MLLSTAHFPPIHYFTKVLKHGKLTLEALENYQRQSYRNRFSILGANGPINLYVPVVKGHSPGQPIKEVRIDYSNKWQRIHFKTISSAYRHSPFYEYYIDFFLPFWSRRWDFLFDLNLAIMTALFDVMDTEIDIEESTEYINENELDADYRKLIHPKLEYKLDPQFNPYPYVQNFSDRFGFVPNLSVLDLIFQAGPESSDIIRKSFREMI
jgi:hypothetical protein